MIRKILNLLLKRPLVVLFLLLLSSLISFYFMSKLEVRSDFTVLLPEDFESVKNLKKVDEAFGGMSHLYVVIEQSDDLLQTRNFVEEATQEIEKIPGIKYVLQKLPVDFFKEYRGLYIDWKDLQEIDRRIEKSLKNSQKYGTSPIFTDLVDVMDPEDSARLDLSDIQKKYEEQFEYFFPRKTQAEESSHYLEWDPRDEGYYYSLEDQFFVLWVKSEVSFLDLDANEKLLKQVRGALDEVNKKKFSNQFQYEFTGSYKTLLDQNQHLRSQVYKVFFVVFILLTTIITLFYRNIFHNILIGLPLLVSMSWSGALTYFLIGHVNVITSFTGFVLLGLGSDYAIFIIGRYEQERKKQSALPVNLWQTYRSAGRASLSAYATTLAGFVALLFSDFLGFFEFGVVGAIGMTTNYFGILLLLPSLIWLMEKFNLFEKGKLPLKFLDRLPDFFNLLVKAARYGKVFSVFTIALLIFGFFVLPEQFKIEFKDSGIENRELVSWKLEQKVKKIVGNRMRPPTILATSLDQERKIVTALAKKDTKDYYHHVLYLDLFVPDKQNQKRELAQKIAANVEKLNLPKDDETREWLTSLNSLSTTANIIRDSLPSSLSKIFLPINNKTDVFSSIFIFYKGFDLGTRESIKKFPKIFGDIPLADGTSVTTVHEAFVIADILSLVEIEGPQALVLIFTFLTLVVLLDFRSLKKSAIVLIPMLMTIPLLTALTYLFGVKLNVLNVSLIPIIFAIGIDSFLHYFHYYEEHKTGFPKVAKGILPAVFMATFTSLIGFGGFVVANTKYLQSMGWLSIIGIVMIFLLVTLVFPTWIQLWYKSHKKNKL